MLRLPQVRHLLHPHMGLPTLYFDLGWKQGLRFDNRDGWLHQNQAGEWIDEVSYVDITLWGRTAEVAAEYLTKGSPVFIEGRLKQDSWEKDGKKNYKLKVVGERLQLIGSKGAGGGGGRPQGGSNFEENEYSGGGEHESSGPPAPRASAPARAPQATQPPPDEIPF